MFASFKIWYNYIHYIKTVKDFARSKINSIGDYMMRTTTWNSVILTVEWNMRYSRGYFPKIIVDRLLFM